MMAKYYKLKCSNCGIQDHEVSAVSRTKGVKLRCCLCQRQHKYWHNLKKLYEQQK